MVTLMNFHFTTTKAHITRLGGEVVELVDKKGLIPQSDDPFKGDFNLDNLRQTIDEYTPEKVAFVRVEAGTNLIGGQPVSLENMLAVTDICHQKGVISVLDASLLQDNLYFIKTREPGMADKSVREITRMIADLFGNCDKLYPAPQTVGKTKVFKRYVLDTFNDRYAFKRYISAESDPGKYCDLACGIKPGEIVMRVCFGIAQSARRIKRFFKRFAVSIHMSQYVVCGPVKDTGDAGDRIGFEAFAQGRYHRYTAADARLVKIMNAVINGSLLQFAAVLVHNGFV